MKNNPILKEFTPQTHLMKNHIVLAIKKQETKNSSPKTTIKKA